MAVFDSPEVSRTLTTRELLADQGLQLRCRLIAGAAGLDRSITHPRIQKSGLAMVGHLHGIVPTRLQILGETELSYAESLPVHQQLHAARQLFSMQLACVVVSRGVLPPKPFIEEAERTSTPLVICEERSSAAITSLHTLLDERLAPR